MLEQSVFLKEHSALLKEQVEDADMKAMRPKGTASHLRHRRQLAASLLAQGKGIRDVARLVKASPSSVCRWKEMIQQRGLQALRAKPHPGRRPRLSPQDKARLVAILLQGPRAAGYQTELWTCPCVAAVIYRTFGVRYHPDHISRLPRTLGWSCQQRRKWFYASAATA